MVLRKKNCATRHVEPPPFIRKKNSGSSWITIQPFKKIRMTSLITKLGMMEPWNSKEKIMLKVDVYMFGSCGSLFEVPFFQTFLFFLSDPPPEKNNLPTLKGLGCLREGLLFSIRKAWFLFGRLVHVFLWELMCLYMKDLFVQQVKVGKLIFDAKSKSMPNDCVGWQMGFQL